MKDKRIVFMGTPEYSVPVLKMLNENFKVVLVVSQKDKEVGRKKVLTACPVKKYATENNIPCFTPDKIKESYEEILKYNPDIIVTCAYGQIIPEELIYSPKYHTVNVHASLLPKYRGGAPIHHAIINGEKETGITIMYTDKGMDSGDIIVSKKIEIDIDDTYEEVSKKLSILGANLLLEVLPSIFDGTAPRIKQDESKVSYARIIKRDDEHIDFNDTSYNVHNKIRGLSMKPGAYALLNNVIVKIYKSTLNDCRETDKKPGTVTRIDKEGIYVSCKDKEIKILKIQVSGKKEMAVKDYLNGIDKDELVGSIFI